MMTTTTGRHGQARRGLAELLAEQATPEVLRGNPFRVIGLPTDASNRDLRRRAEQSRRDPDVPADEVERIEAALRRLRDPGQRLIDELLWYWPDDADGASDHNSAIRELLDLVEGDGSEVVERCRRAITAMARSLGVATTGHIEGRVVALDDPRLTAADARRLVEEARLLVPLLALRMAVRAHGTGDEDLALRLVGAVRASAGADVARDAAAKVLEPTVGRVRAVIDAAERASRTEPAQRAERAARLLEQTAADRALVDALLDESDPSRAGVVDRIADQVIGDVISFYNETNDDGTAIRLLEQARALRPRSATQARIDDNLEVIRTNAELGRCWFCQAAPGDPAGSYELDLYGDVQRDYVFGRITWQSLKLPVPRCPACAAEHRGRAGSKAAGCLSTLVVLVGCVVVAALGFPLLLVLPIALVLALVIPGFMGPRPGKVRRQALQFPPVREKLASGWALGTRPPGTR